MTEHSSIDPAPRKYAAAVTLVRRSSAGPAGAPASTSIAAIEAWLLDNAGVERDLLALFESLVWRLVGAGLPLDRASLHVGTLHPQLYGFAWNWNSQDRLCDEVKVAEAALRSDSYRRNPLFQVIEHGQEIDLDLRDAAAAARYPLMADLAAEGITAYLALPLGGGADYHNAATLATRRPEGFDAAEIAALKHLMKIFALHVERYIAWRIAGNVLEAYLGAEAGRQVLQGAIKRGSGRPIRAVIWMSDLRGFTDLSDRLGGADMITLLNSYFERMAGAVLQHGGEVLKFIGDGLLAAFPVTATRSERMAANAALAAAGDAMAAIERLNAEPIETLLGIAGWRPLQSGIALHLGEVFFGNIGAPERLDFTVIGPAVNVASRVEALSKSLGRSILITEQAAACIDRPLDRLGRHALRGVSGEIELFSPR